MGQISPFLRRADGAYTHWCPGCLEMHRLPDSWSFNGNVNQPTFTPSFRHSGIRRVFVNGEWTGDWLKDAQGNPIPFICHYILTNGILNFCGDCTHQLSSKAVPLPLLPESHRDTIS